MDEAVSGSRCIKCKRIMNVVYLTKNKNGIGKICIDTEACKKELDKEEKWKEKF